MVPMQASLQFGLCFRLVRRLVHPLLSQHFNYTGHETIFGGQ